MLVITAVFMVVEAVAGWVSGDPGVKAVHDLHVWSVTSGAVALSGHVVVRDLTHHPAALAGLKEAVAGLGIGHATIQLEVAD